MVSFPWYRKEKDKFYYIVFWDYKLLNLMCKKEKKKKKQSGNTFSFLHKKETEQEYNENVCKK